MASPKPKILYVLHCYNNRGGVEEHTKALSEGLKDRFEISIVFPESGSLFLKTEQGTQQFPADPAIWPATPYHSAQTEASLGKVLNLVEPDLIHIQHFLNWHLGLLDQVVAYGAATAISFHEYYAITPHFTMQGVREPHETFSKEYSTRVFNADISEYLEQRKKIIAASLANIPHQIVPSKFLALELAKVFPREYRVIPHGIQAFEVDTRSEANDETLRLGYLGSLIPQKGWESLLKGFELARKKHPNLELHLFGGGGKPEEEKIEGAVFHGVYDQVDLPRILASIDVGVVPSVFRETFCYVLSEMRQAGLPVAVSDIGALSERTEPNVNGQLFRPGDPESIADTLSWFAEHPEWRSWNIPKPRLLKEMLDEYESLYLGALSS